MIIAPDFGPEPVLERIRPSGVQNPKPSRTEGREIFVSCGKFTFGGAIAYTQLTQAQAPLKVPRMML